MSRVDQLFQATKRGTETDYATLRIGEYIFINKHEICDDMHLVFVYIHRRTGGKKLGRQK